MWVSNNWDGTVTELRASTGGFVNTYPVGGADGGEPMATGVAFDGVYVWVTNTWFATVTKLRAVDGKNFGTFQVGPQTIALYGLAFDGANIWVAYGPIGRAGGAYKL